MKYEVVVETAQAELVAAVRATVSISEVARAWKPALDQVWAFLKQNSELAPGHNLFLYHHPDRRNEPMNIDFGVQVGPCSNGRAMSDASRRRLVKSHGPFMSVLTID